MGQLRAATHGQRQKAHLDTTGGGGGGEGRGEATCPWTGGPYTCTAQQQRIRPLLQEAGWLAGCVQLHAGHAVRKGGQTHHAALQDFVQVGGEAVRAGGAGEPLKRTKAGCVLVVAVAAAGACIARPLPQRVSCIPR